MNPLKRKDPAEEETMDVPVSMDGSGVPANPLPDPPENYSEEEKIFHEGNLYLSPTGVQGLIEVQAS